jgi:carbonic anhydrase/acetyltransferase-like protein (isoleucine patch superfamily)
VTSNKKYKLIKTDYLEQNEEKIYRIKALRDFGLVRKGDVGGYVGAESNLSHEGGAWAYDNACVYGDAHVYDNACVYGDAHVYDNACVYGDARVSGDACVFGNAWVFGDACVYGDAHVYDNACVYGDARVYGDACVFGNACVFGDAHVYDNACVFGNAHVYGNAYVYGNARVSGDACVYGNARISESVHVKYHRVTSDICNNKNLAQLLLSSLNVVTNNNSKLVLFKVVRKTSKKRTFCSLYDAEFLYTVGKVEEAVNVDPNTTSCASGLHVSTPTYWLNYKTSDCVLIACEIDIKDIITVQEGKVRCKKLKVLGVCGE